MSSTAAFDDARWRVTRLYSAPHRIAFAAGALTLALSALWWAGAMLAQAGGHPLRFGLPPFQVHGLVMALGFMPLFFTGFLFTAGPRWLGQPPIVAAGLAPPLLAQLCGWAVFLLGAHGPDPAFGAVLGGLGMAAAAIGWTQVCVRFWALLRASRVPDRSHARVVACAAAVGVFCFWAAALGTALSQATPLGFGLLRSALHVGLWGFIGTCSPRCRTG